MSYSEELQESYKQVQLNEDESRIFQEISQITRQLKLTERNLKKEIEGLGKHNKSLSEKLSTMIKSGDDIIAEIKKRRSGGFLESFKRNDTVIHRKKGSSGKVMKTNKDGSIKVKWNLTKSSSDIDPSKIAKI